MNELTPQEVLTSTKILFDPQPYIQLLMKALEDTLDARDAAVKLLAEVKQPIYNDQWDVCWYCEEWCGNDYDNIPHTPDCLTVRIKALLAKEATE